jgi:23S rRNA (cytidine1920-2'-O)/16S rRNA (cytidine1409-2'-O)-methyltransferase
VFGISVEGKVALDCGAAAGGFTKVLLERGARRVYAVDAGHGQLLGSLRQDPRVVNLEGVNLGELDRERVPDDVELVTLDLSYLSVAAAVPQLRGLAAQAELVALVKPMFELGLPRPPADEDQIARALALAADGVQRAGWRVVGAMPSPVTGARGAREHLLYARTV